MNEQLAGAPRAWTRAGGVFYLITLGASAFAEYYLRPGLIVRDNAAPTAHNIMASEQLYRLALLCDLAGTVAYTGVTAALYILLKPVSRNLSLLAALSSVAGVAVGAVALAYSIAPLFLLSGASWLGGFTGEQLQGLAMLSLKLRTQVFTLGIGFFGIYCIVVGWLIARSTFFPRIIGVILAIGGVGYLIDVTAKLASPALASLMYPYTYVPGFAGEIALALWLVIVGVNATKWSAQAGSAAAR